jgi:ferredoxin
MSKVRFLPDEAEFVVEPSSKVLAVALRHKIKIQYGCAACRCGTCGVKVKGGPLSPMRTDERALLERMRLPLDGSVRLACQARVEEGAVIDVDLSFQTTYSPDQGDADED